MTMPNRAVFEVKKKFSEAFPVFNEKTKMWQILVQDGEDYYELGCGTSAREAWDKALENISE